MARKRDPFTNSANLNNLTYNDYYNRLMELALNVFHWEGLPPTVSERYLELQLYSRGYCVYFRDPIIGDLALMCTIGGELDVYQIPIYRNAFSPNGYQASLDANDSVLIFNNYLHTPTVLSIELFARRLTEIERAIDVNVKGQKTPVLILSKEAQRLTMQNLYMKYDGNQPFIFGDKSLDLDGVQVFKTDAPYVADRLQVLKHQIWNECMTFLGIENSNEDKRERLVSAEVVSNYGSIEAQRNVMLNARIEAAEQINRMFGTNITVRFNSALDTMVNRPNLGLDPESVSRETEVQEAMT